MDQRVSTPVSHQPATAAGISGPLQGGASGFSECIVDAIPLQGNRSGAAAANFLTVLRQLPQCLAESDDDAPSLTKMADVLQRAGQLECLAWFERNQRGLSDKPEIFMADESPQLQLELAETAARAANSRVTETCGVSRNGSSWIVIASPVQTELTSGGCLVGAFRIGRESPVWLAGQIELAALILGYSLTNRSRIVAEQELGAAAAIIDLAARLERSNNLDEACQTLVNEMSRHTACPQVAIGTVASESASCRLRAHSGDRRSSLATDTKSAIEAAFDEIIIRDEESVWPPEVETRRTGLLTHRRLVDEGIAECVIGAPLRNRDGSVFGAWVFFGESRLISTPVMRQFLRACEYRLAETLNLVKRAERPAWKRSLHGIILKLGGSPKRTAAFGAAIMAGLCAIPIPHNVSGNCELQPVTRRFIAAPFDGTLKKTLVEPGDVVEENQLLARMDDREINLELAVADDEHHRASKERDTHLANQDIAAAQLARYEMERLKLRQRLLTHRSENLEIRSSIAGLIIDGELKRSEGFPLATGDTMFEVAPIDRMVVEIAIPETDIAHVNVGQDVSVSLKSVHGQSLTGKIVRIHPRSVMKDDTHVFIGEVEFANPDGRLLPGMHGHASIDSGFEPIGWIVFHRPSEAFLFWMGW